MPKRKHSEPDVPQPHPNPPSLTTQPPVPNAPQYLINKARQYFLETRTAQFHHNEDRRIAVISYFAREGDRINLQNHYQTHGDVVTNDPRSEDGPHNEDGSHDERWFENPRHDQMTLCDTLLDSMATQDTTQQDAGDSHWCAQYTQRRYRELQSSIRDRGIPSTCIDHRPSPIINDNPNFNE
jgi:hypothetical protein